MTDDAGAKARAAAHGLIQGHIGSDHKRLRYEGLLFHSHAGAKADENRSPTREGPGSSPKS